jgi:hypothetical protein
MSTLMIPKSTAQILRDLTGEPRPDAALLLVLQDARLYRLEQIEADLRSLESKYGMTFEEYRQRWEREDRDEDYHWEVEQDYLRWEALVTQKRRLEGMPTWLP